MKELTLILPLAPSINHYWKHSARRGYLHTYIPEKGMNFRASVIYSILQYRNKINNFGILFQVKRLSVTLLIHFDSKRRNDIDNRIKCVLDALQHASVYKDDCQIDKLLVERKEIIKGGKMIVNISEIS